MSDCQTLRGRDGGRGLTAKGYKVSFWDDGNIPIMILMMVKLTDL